MEDHITNPSFICPFLLSLGWRFGLTMVGTALLFLLLQLNSAAVSRQMKATSYPNFSYSFLVFDDPKNPNLTIYEPSGMAFGALQLTPDTGYYPEKLLTHKAGRVLLNQSFMLWNSQQISNPPIKRVASFSTSFNMIVARSSGTIPGEGLTFLVTSYSGDPLPGSDGGYLGLTNTTDDGIPSYNFVAIEFDTFQQSYDQNDNHVGLDINSIISNTTANLTSFGIEISPVLQANWSVWIDYDGTRHHITVYINTSGSPKPASPILSATLDLSEHLQQWSYFGFSASTGTNYQLNCILAWNLTVENLMSDPSSAKFRWWASKYAIASSVLTVVVAIVIGILIGCYLTRRGRGDGTTSLTETLNALPGTPRELKFMELKRATNNFDERLKLGQGGFGVVYKGLIVGEENMEIAVKKFSREGVSCQDDFLKELTIINCLRHKHLVRLIGWCHKKGMLLIVYEFMPNGSLDQHLYGGPGRPLLSWERRYDILSGLASALHYLHDQYDQMVVHRDLKPSNVMLDAAFNARLGDFGLARALDTNKTSYTELELGGMPGTPGYIAPECFHTGKATRQSDVFGFGVVVLEVASGQLPRGQNGCLSDWVWKFYREGRILEAVDPLLSGNYVTVEADRLLQLGLICSHPIASERPRMQAVMQILVGGMSLPEVPQYKPAFTWPAGDAGESSTSTTTNTVVTTIGS